MFTQHPEKPMTMATAREHAQKQLLPLANHRLREKEEAEEDPFVPREMRRTKKRRRRSMFRF
jgi:hypothetical protein